MTEKSAVTCACCQTAHDDGADGAFGPGVAGGCAAFIAHDGIRTYHGSTHEGENFAWIARPDWAVDGLVCDACIARLQAEGAVESTVKFDPDLNCWVMTLLPDDEAAQQAEDDRKEALYGPDDAPVACASCGTRHHHVISAHSRQAQGCAAEATDAGVTGAYGSHECDLEHWPWAERPDWAQNGVICDACLRRAKTAGAFAPAVGVEAFGLDGEELNF